MSQPEMTAALANPADQPAAVAEPAADFAQPLWLQDLIYPALEDRGLIDSIWPNPGVLGAADLAVGPRAEGANMSVDIAAGRVLIAGTDMANQGKYLCRLANRVNVAVTPAPAAGLTRIDLVVARVYDDAVAGGGRNEWAVEAVTGTPVSANPQPPTGPPSSVALAQITVASGTAAITPALIADRRVSARPPVVQAGRGVYTYQSAFNGVTVLFDRLFATVCRSVVFTVSVGNLLGHQPFSTDLVVINPTGFSFRAYIANGSEFGNGTQVPVEWTASGD